MCVVNSPPRLLLWEFKLENHWSEKTTTPPCRLSMIRRMHTWQILAKKTAENPLDGCSASVFTPPMGVLEGMCPPLPFWNLKLLFDRESGCRDLVVEEGTTPRVERDPLKVTDQVGGGNFILPRGGAATSFTGSGTSPSLHVCWRQLGPFPYCLISPSQVFCSLQSKAW